MKTRAIIEKSESGGYGIYLPDIPGYIGLGETEDEAKGDLREAIDLVVEDCKARGIKDDVNGGNIEFEYSYDLSGFFKSFNIFNVSALAKRIGVNSGLLRQYKSGEVYISEQRKKNIEDSIHKLGNELSLVKF